jgi:hypothetical protein
MEVIDLFWHYSTTGGSAIEKIHPGAYALFGVVAIALFSERRARTPADHRLLRASYVLAFALVFVILLSLMTGHTQGESVLLDSLMVGPATAIAMVELAPRDRFFIFKLIMYFIILNDIITIGEFATKHRLLPYAFEEEATFRPAGLMGHPLSNGGVNVIALCLVWAMPWPAGRRLALLVFFLVADFATQARISTISGVIVAMAGAWIFLWDSVRRKKIDEGTLVLATVVSILLIVVALVVLVTAGFADRLIQSGLNDQSAQSRFVVYRIFSYLTSDEVLFGVSRDWSTYVLQNQFQNTSIENPVVGFIIQFGAIGTAVLVPALIYFIWATGRVQGSAYTMLTVISFLIGAATNVSVAGKGPSVVMIAALCIGANAANAQRARARPAKQMTRLAAARR